MLVRDRRSGTGIHRHNRFSLVDLREFDLAILNSKTYSVDLLVGERVARWSFALVALRLGMSDNSLKFRFGAVDVAS